MTEGINRVETHCVNDKVVQNQTNNQNESTKNLLLAGLSIFAPGAAAGILAGEAIKDSGVLESDEFKSFAQTAKKTAVTAYAGALFGLPGIFAATSIMDSSAKNYESENTQVTYQQTSAEQPVEEQEVTYQQTSTEQPVQQEVVYTNENIAQDTNNAQNETSKNLLLAGLSIFAPGAAAGVLAGEAIKDSGVLESDEFKSFAQTAKKTAATAYAGALFGLPGIFAATSIMDSSAQAQDSQNDQNGYEA